MADAAETQVGPLDAPDGFASSGDEGPDPQQERDACRTATACSMRSTTSGDLSSGGRAGDSEDEACDGARAECRRPGAGDEAVAPSTPSPERLRRSPRAAPPALALDRPCSAGGAGRRSASASAPSSPASCASPAGSSSGVRLPAISPARTGSVGALGRGGVSRAHLTIAVTSRFDGAEMSVELAEGELGPGCAGVPEQLSKDATVKVTFRSPGAIIGMLRVCGAPPIPFGVQVKPSPGPRASVALGAGAERFNFVSSENRQRSVVAHALGDLELGSGTDARGDGVVVETTVGPGHRAEMVVNIRKAKKKELARLAQEQALLSAMEQKKYSSLLAQISRARMRKVEASLLEQAGRLLKSLSMPESLFLSHKELAKLMKWKRVTAPAGGSSDDVVPCSLSDACPCNAGKAQYGEVCDVTNDMVARALEGIVPSDQSADRWLFKALVKAALVAPEGCVWKSGGKFLLTNEDRNQAPTAIVNVLERGDPNSDAGKGMRALVSFTEQEYGFRVTAIQLNFHPNNKSSHKQHRDIYGAGQKGGINCTCSFMKCTGTVCFSLGSSRQVLTQTITDSRSKYEACGDDCPGCLTYRWVHSGSAMYFNAPWNNNHTHGVPPMEDACGPRISVALLCA